MIDFDALILAPAMATFARPITVLPLASRPGEPPYTTRGVWSERPVDVQTEDGAILSSAVKTLGVRLSEFTVPVVAGDRVSVDGTTYQVDDTDDDGQGGSLWTLKEIR